MSGPAKESQPQVAGISISPEQLKRLLSKLLPTTLLGERLPLGFYAQIGFRFLALPAWADETERLSKTQQFSSLIRLDAARVLQGSIRTITDGHLTTEDILALTKRLDEPRFRLVCELFWPHLATPQFEVLRSAKELTDDTVLKMLESGASAATSAIMRKHAFAIVRHCHAINHELQNLMDRKSAVDGLWPKALALWTNVCSDQEFWIYMEERARKQDDPRLKAEDLAQAQKELPAIILGIHELLTDYYFSIDRTDDCIRHLQIIRESGFDKQAVHDSILRAVKRIALSRLDSLMQRSVAAFSDIKDRIAWKKFEAICSPFVQEAVDIQNIIVERLKIPGKYLEESAFDAIVEVFVRAPINKLNIREEIANARCSIAHCWTKNCSNSLFRVHYVIKLKSLYAKTDGSFTESFMAAVMTMKTRPPVFLLLEWRLIQRRVWLFRCTALPIGRCKSTAIRVLPASGYHGINHQY